MITKLQITGKLDYHRKCDFQLSKRKLGYRKLGYRTLLPLPGGKGLRPLLGTYRRTEERPLLKLAAGTPVEYEVAYLLTSL